MYMASEILANTGSAITWTNVDIPSTILSGINSKPFIYVSLDVSGDQNGQIHTFILGQGCLLRPSVIADKGRSHRPQ